MPRINAKTKDEAVELIQDFYEAVVGREQDELQSVNFGRHQEAIHAAGNNLFAALTGLQPAVDTTQR